MIKKNDFSFAILFIEGGNTFYIMRALLKKQSSEKNRPLQLFEVGDF